MRDLPQYLLYRALAGIFGLLPEPMARRIGTGLGYLLSYLAPGRLRIAERHMRRVLDSGVDVRSAARKMFASYGRYWAEVFWIRPGRREEFVEHSRLEGQDILHAARDSGRGIVLALPHIGNWEAAGARAHAEGIPVLAAAEALRNRRLVEWFVRARNEVGIDVVLAGEGSGVTRALIERLRAGGTVALLCDRDLKGTGVKVEFFGEETTIPAGPVALADRTGAVLLPVGSYFAKGRGHTFVIHEPVELEDLPASPERVGAGTQRLAGKLEEIIRAAPTQWHLLVPNWPSDREAV